MARVPIALIPNVLENRHVRVVVVGGVCQLIFHPSSEKWGKSRQRIRHAPPFLLPIRGKLVMVAQGLRATRSNGFFSNPEQPEKRKWVTSGLPGGRGCIVMYGQRGDGEVEISRGVCVCCGI